MTATLYIGDSAERCAQLEPGSVDLLCCSPPFLALRSYLPPGHPDKAREIGQERTPAAFLDVLLGLTNGPWARVLAPHGSLAVELGDTYSGMGGAGSGDTSGPTKTRRTDGDYPIRDDNPRPSRSHRVPNARTRTGYNRDDRPGRGPQRSDDLAGRLANGGGSGWPLGKSLCGIPTLYAWSLAYGRNLLRAPLAGWELLAEARRVVDDWRTVGYEITADELIAELGGFLRAHEDRGPASEFDPWRIRNVICWVRPNPPVGALGDKFRPATSFVTVATRAGDRWFDLDAVRQPGSTNNHATGPVPPGGRERDRQGRGRLDGTSHNGAAGAPPLDWWEISPGGYSGAHYAVWPKELCRRLILAMCPRKVCTTCGQPSRRIIEVAYEATAARDNGSKAVAAVTSGVSSGHHAHRETNPVRTVTAEHWSDCGHDTWRPGLVLDPFAGSGTTLAVASGLGRDSVGIDLDVANAALCMERVGPLLLDVVWPDPDWSLLVLPAGSPHPSVYDPWRHQLDDVRAGIVGWLLDCWVAAVAVAMGVPLEAVDEIGSVPARPRARTAPVMAGQGGLFV